jgi:hypothetical protein
LFNCNLLLLSGQNFMLSYGSLNCS